MNRHTEQCKAEKETKKQMERPKGRENELDPDGKLRYRRTEEDIVKGRQRRITELTAKQSTRVRRNAQERMRRASLKTVAMNKTLEARALRVFKVNNYPAGTGITNSEDDVIKCYGLYIEPRFNYEQQTDYWLKKPANI